MIKFCWKRHGQKLWRYNFYFKIPFLRRHIVTNLAGIIKITSMFIKTTFKDSEKVKRIRKYVLKWNLHLYFLKNTKVAEFRWKNAKFTEVVCHEICMFLLILFMYGYLWQILGKSGLFYPPPKSVSSLQKSPSIMGLKLFKPSLNLVDQIHI